MEDPFELHFTATSDPIMSRVEQQRAILQLYSFKNSEAKEGL
jgi:hypothetical protein